MTEIFLVTEDLVSEEAGRVVVIRFQKLSSLDSAGKRSERSLIHRTGHFLMSGILAVAGRHDNCHESFVRFLHRLRPADGWKDMFR
jgi:hypothetical protein